MKNDNRHGENQNRKYKFKWKTGKNSKRWIKLKNKSR